MELVGWVSVALLVGGVVGSVVPLVPGALTSLAGVYLFWWASGYTSPSPFVLVGLTLLGLVTLVVDYAGGAVAARAGGASTLTTALAVVVGLVLALVAGPVGVLVGVAGTVFLVEYRREGDADASVRTAAYATVGVLASSVVQVVLTGTMLVVFLLVVL